MELETTRLINISFKNEKKYQLSYEKDVKKLTNLLKFLITFLSIFFFMIVFIIFLILKSKNYIIRIMESKKVVQDLNYYIERQNYFCDYIHKIYDKELEEELILHNVSLGNITFEMFLYKTDDYISNKIQKYNYLDGNDTLHILSALQQFANDNHIVNPKEVVMLDIGGHIGWYSTFLGTFKYTIITFEPLPKNYYILKKNYCRNNRDFFGDISSIIIIDKGIYSEETTCDYYKDIESNKRNIILCDSSQSDKLNSEYKKISSVEMRNLTYYLQYMDNRNIALIRIDTNLEGEMALETGKELFTHYRTPYLFIEFSKKAFADRESDPKKFLQFFIDNGYQISLDGFLNSTSITIDQIMENNNIENVNLFLTFIKPS